MARFEVDTIQERSNLKATYRRRRYCRKQATEACLWVGLAGEGRDGGREEGVGGGRSPRGGANNGFQPFQWGMVTSNDGGTLPLPLAERDFDTNFMVQ